MQTSRTTSFAAQCHLWILFCVWVRVGNVSDRSGERIMSSMPTQDIIFDLPTALPARKHRWSKLPAIAAVICLCSPPTFAATIFVTSTSGASNVTGSCVIRDAITSANAQTPVGGCVAGSMGGNTIELPPGGAVISLTDIDNSDESRFTGYGANGLPIITSSLTIHGNGATIQRSTDSLCNQDGIQDPGEFRLLMISAPSVEISDTTFRNGCADSIQQSFFGGTDGAIMVTADMATTLLLRRVRLTDNFAYYAIPAIGQAAGSLRLEYSTIDHNVGGILAATITVADPNDLSCNSGGHVDFRMFNSTISDNGEATSTVFGCGTAQIENSTLTNNLSNPTFYYRAAPAVDNAIKIKNSIIADNAGNSCDLGFDDSTIAIIGDNLSSDETCAGFSLFDTPARLAPLANYGGPTPTHMPLTSSAAIDAVMDCTRKDGTPVTDDQRSASRPLLGRPNDAVRCDIGAVESNGDIVFIANFG